MEKERANGFALIPIIVFLVLYVGSGIYFQYVKGQDQGFYVMSVVVAFTIAIIVALIQNPGKDFDAKLKIMARGMGDENIMIMILIFLLAGAFSSIATAAGGSESIAYLLLSFIPAKQMVFGFFLISCILSMAMGTSTGTITVLVPIAVAAAGAADLNLPLVLGTIIGGAMFGDNMSFISDTTIAATKTQGCEMKDKFRANFKIAFPAAVVTGVILLFLSGGAGTVQQHEFQILQAIPYFVVLVMALIGMNVLLVLGIGIILFSLIGLITQPGFDIPLIFTSMGEGTKGMFETIIVAVLVAALGALIKENGGFAYVLAVIKRRFRGKSGGQAGIAVLSSAMDVATGNNTVAIVMAAPIAKEISLEYGITPQKTASLLDIFTCIWQGIIPYGAQMLIAIGLVSGFGVTAFDVIPHLYYIFALFICAVISIIIPEKGRHM